MSTHPSRPTYDELLATLANRRRRAALRHLREQGATPLDDLAVRLREAIGGPGPADGADALVTTLHHHHLPSLERVGLVEYDPTKRTVRPTIDDPRVSEVLAITFHEDRP